MNDCIMHIGMDVDKEHISIAIADGGRDEEVLDYGRIDSDLGSIDKLIRKLQSKQKKGKKLRFVYEAGPCGYTIYRHLRNKGIECGVVAPSLIPRASGDRVKTNRRDAIKLARLDRAGELREVYVPKEEDEAMRDLSRGRGAAVRATTKVQQQSGAMVLRNGIRYMGEGKKWSKAYREWLRGLKMGHAVQQIVLAEYLEALEEGEKRVKRLTEEMEKMVPGWRMEAVVKALQALRGVRLVTAVGMVAEVGDMTRFEKPRELMAYLGLVPTENSTGDKRKLGGITKTGNTHARRAVVESAWLYTGKAAVSKVIKERQKEVSKEVKEISWKAQLRLCGKYRRLVARGKRKQTAVIAVARELAGFMWAIAREVSKEGVKAEGAKA